MSEKRKLVVDQIREPAQHIANPIKKKVIGYASEDQMVTLTFGEQAENHAGMQILGDGLAPSGFSIDDLLASQVVWEAAGAKTELVRLDNEIGIDISPEIEPAAVLIIRNGLSIIFRTEEDNGDDGTNKLLQEQLSLRWDTKAKMRGRVVNKHARFNVCYGDMGQEPDYDKGKGRIVPFSEVPTLFKVREGLVPFFGDKASKLQVEGNLYYDPTKCGIGFHGDSERRKVIAARLGHKQTPLHYQWFHRSEPIGNRIVLPLHHGDMYCMSAKATGTDWKCRSKPTLRHATGCEKFLRIAKK
jgi:hypothetical protein